MIKSKKFKKLSDQHMKALRGGERSGGEVDDCDTPPLPPIGT